MSIEAITALGAASLTAAAPVAPAVRPTESVFSTMLDSIQDLSAQMQVNDRGVQGVALGETDNLHHVMMDMERTKLTFELMLQVRNKTLEAYQELMRMQV